MANVREWLAQREKRQEALRLEDGNQVGSVLARAQASWDASRFYSDEILARSDTATIVPVLDAQRAHVPRLSAAAHAMSELEQAAGTPRERLFELVDEESR